MIVGHSLIFLWKQKCTILSLYTNRIWYTKRGKKFKHTTTAKENCYKLFRVHFTSKKKQDFSYSKFQKKKGEKTLFFCCIRLSPRNYNKSYLRKKNFFNTILFNNQSLWLTTSTFTLERKGNLKKLYFLLNVNIRADSNFPVNYVALWNMTFFSLHLVEWLPLHM